MLEGEDKHVHQGEDGLLDNPLLGLFILCLSGSVAEPSWFTSKARQAFVDGVQVWFMAKAGGFGTPVAWTVSREPSRP